MSFPKLCTSSNSFSPGFLTSPHSLQIEIVLLLSFYSGYFLLFFFPCEIALTPTSSIVLNKTSESGHPHFVPDLRERLPLSYHWVWCHVSWGFFWMPFFMWGRFLLFLVCSMFFIMKAGWSFWGFFFQMLFLCLLR